MTARITLLPENDKLEEHKARSAPEQVTLLLEFGANPNAADYEEAVLHLSKRIADIWRWCSAASAERFLAWSAGTHPTDRG